jgi:predicted nucleic-acid-binding Zn-ribbon protein
MSNDRYLLVSCSLCGYTEIYNLKVIADARQEDLCPRAVPEPREG